MIGKRTLGRILGWGGSVMLLFPHVGTADPSRVARDGLESEVSLVDAGRQALPGNRFVEGEAMLVKVRLRNLASLDARDREARDLVRAAHTGSAPSAAVPTEDARASALSIGHAAVPWTDRVALSIGGSGLAAERVAQPTPVVTQLVDTTVEYWKLESLTPTASTALEVRYSFTSPASGRTEDLAHSIPYTVVSRGMASNAELARVEMRSAQSLMDQHRYAEAAASALEALQLGPADEIDVATLYEVVGAANEALGDAPAAVLAYQLAIETIERAQPGRSKLPEILGARIERLSTP